MCSFIFFSFFLFFNFFFLLKLIGKDVIAESWVDVGENGSSPAPSNYPAEDYLRLLREAQRESNQSSALVSLASTRKNSPHST